MGRRYRPFEPFERGPFERPIAEVRIPRPPRRFWVGLALFGLAFLVFFLAAPLVGFWTEMEWYESLGLRDVYLTRVGLQAALFSGSFGIALAYLVGNVLIALRVRAGPALRAVGIRRPVIRSLAGAGGLVAALIVALILSGGAGSQWQALALFMHASPAGVTEPVLGQDVSFYLLQLPFLDALASWVLGLGFMALLVSAALYTWRGDSFDLRLTPLAIGHLSVLLGLLAIAIAGSTWLGRYHLLYEHNGYVWGAGYTDANVRVGFAALRTGVVFALGLVLIANLQVRRLAVPVAAVGIWLVLVVAGALYPATIQRVAVTPNEFNQEQPYIEREIAFTRQAFGLSSVTLRNYNGSAPLTQKAIQDDQVTIDNLRLWDHRPLSETYEQLQTIRTYYTFYDIDLDRYTVAGRYQQLEISARELAPGKLARQASGFVNQRLLYTHGYGLAASPVNAVKGEGLPDYVVGDIPPNGPLKVDRPAIYFGEVNGEWVLAPSARQEFDYPSGTQDNFAGYQGTHGVFMSGAARALWSLRLSDFNLLISNQITDRTQLLYRRSIQDRVQAIAPFLTLDRDPYIVVVDGKLYWIQDAYTMASTYPYSQQQPDGENYIRNSVKIVIDAYEGTTDFYLADPKDPLIKAWELTFPTLFKPLDQMPRGLQAHLRTPEDLFLIQTDVYRTYHVSDARVFYLGEDVWDVPTEQTGPTSPQNRLQPYYVLMRLPGEQQAEYLLILPFTPRGKQNLVSWLAARNDIPHYGELVSFVLPKDKVIFGPQQIANRINSNTTISKDFSLLNREGSAIVQGNLLVVPVGDSFLYFEPVYLKASQAQSLPELKKVILADAQTIAYADTLAGALEQLTGQAAPPPPPGNLPPQAGGQVADLAQQALQHYQLALAALKAGDFATFGRELDLLGQVLQRLAALTSGTATPSPSPGASPTASPRASASPTR